MAMAIGTIGAIAAQKGRFEAEVQRLPRTTSSHLTYFPLSVSMRPPMVF